MRCCDYWFFAKLSAKKTSFETYKRRKHYLLCTVFAGITKLDLLSGSPGVPERRKHSFSKVREPVTMPTCQVAIALVCVHLRHPISWKIKKKKKSALLLTSPTNILRLVLYYFDLCFADFPLRDASIVEQFHQGAKQYLLPFYRCQSPTLSPPVTVDLRC